MQKNKKKSGETHRLLWCGSSFAPKPTKRGTPSANWANLQNYFFAPFYPTNLAVMIQTETVNSSKVHNFFDTLASLEYDT